MIYRGLLLSQKNLRLPTWHGALCLVLLLAVFPGCNARAEQTNAFLAQCSMCHGADGNSSNSAAPVIAGITQYYFKYTMDAYKNGGRSSDIMKMFAGQLSDNDIAQLAAYYAEQKSAARTQTTEPDKVTAGKRLHQIYCEKCHTNNGGVSIDGYGILAGQWAEYLRMTLAEYEAGKRRTNAMMLTKLKKMRSMEGDGAVEQLIHYYAAQQ